MKPAVIKLTFFIALFSIFAATQVVAQSTLQLVSVLQRYNERQVDELLQKQLDDLHKTISQHETFERRDALAGAKDTVRGVGVLIADGSKLYILTQKHLIKATELLGVTHREVITDFLTAHLNVSKKTNDINLLNLVSISPEASPVIFSDDKTDMAIISLQQRSKKLIVDYIKQNGGRGVPVKNIGKPGWAGLHIEAIVPLLRKLQINERNPNFNK